MTKVHRSAPPTEGRAPKTNASHKLYNCLLFISAFGFVSFLMTAISAPNHMAGLPQLRQEEILAEFLGKREGPDSSGAEDERPTYHVVFSTSCDNQQHWESFVFFYHAHKVKRRELLLVSLQDAQKRRASRCSDSMTSIFVL